MEKEKKRERSRDRDKDKDKDKDKDRDRCVALVGLFCPYSRSLLPLSKV